MRGCGELTIRGWRGRGLIRAWSVQTGQQDPQVGRGAAARPPGAAKKQQAPDADTAGVTRSPLLSSWIAGPLLEALALGAVD